MRKAARIVIGMGIVGALAAPVLAEGGCGPGRFRNGPFGHCHWDGPPPPPPPPAYGPGPAYYGPGPAYRPAPVVVVDRWYPGRGYWDGRRYWGHRHHWRGGWRYY